jgi:hypothetical protein
MYWFVKDMIHFILLGLSAILVHLLYLNLFQFYVHLQLMSLLSRFGSLIFHGFIHICD